MTENPYKLKRPKGLDNYVLDIADHNYLFFRKKERYGFCTSCRKKVDLKESADFSRTELQHNKASYCPCCKTSVIVKDARYGRLGLEENGRVLWFCKRGNITYAQLDEYDIDYQDLKPKICYWESAQYKFSKKEVKYFKHHPFYSTWEDRKNIKLPSAVHGAISWWQSAKYEKTTVYEPSLNNLGSDLKYQSLVFNHKYKLIQFVEAAEFIIRYFDLFLKYPATEILEKSGFDKLVIDKIVGYSCRAVNWRKNNLKDILKLPPSKIKELRKAIEKKGKNGNSFLILEAYRKVKKVFPEEEISFEMAVDLNNYGQTTFETIRSVISMTKAIRYISNQEDMTIGDYKDYINECKKLGKDLRKKRILMPENLKQAHEETSKLIRTEMEQQKAEAFLEHEEEIGSGINHFEYKNLFIRIAENPAELTTESEQLHHCVRTYIDRVCQGKSAILFIRKKAEPDKAFYTVEISPEHKIIQVRGLHNQSATQEVQEFVEKMENELKKQRRKKAA